MLKVYKSVCIAIICFAMLVITEGCSQHSNNQSSLSKENAEQVENLKETNEAKNPIRDIDYSLDLNDSKYMKFGIINYSPKDIELIFSNTHTFDFFLSRDGQLVWDYYKDNLNVGREAWETHQLLKSNNVNLDNIQQGYDIWYESFANELKDGIYYFKFNSTSEKLNDIPPLSGILEIKEGKVNPKSIVLDKR